MSVSSKVNYTITTDHKDLSLDSVKSIYTSIGWGDSKDYDNDSLLIALKRANTIYAAWNNNGTLLGFAKIFSDEAYHTYLAEIVVDKTWHGRGVGKAIMSKILSDYAHTAIYLEALGNNIGFFESCGLKVAEKLTAMSRKKLN